MGAVGRIILIIVVVLAVAAGITFFVLPGTSSRTETITVERPAASVFARLASTPAGTPIAEGVTLTEITSAENNRVVGNVAYGEGETGRVTYVVTPEAEGSSVEIRLEQNVGLNPLDRFQAMSGARVEPFLQPTVAAITADLTALPTAEFTGLQYNVVQVTAEPFFFIQNCAPTDAEAVESVVAQSLLALRPIMTRLNLAIAGEPVAVEPRVEENQYCYRIGYPYTGTPPRVLAVGTAGQTPAGTALRVVYTGTEENVLAEVYDRMDALLAAAHLDDPATTDDDWTTFEVYHDDPLQPGGSRNREIFYVAEGDIAALTRIAPPSEPVAVPSAAPAEATEAAPAAEGTTAPAPATTPAPATP
jgi:hypothetical protein